MAFLEERVDSLEDAHRAFVATVGIEFNKLYNAQMRTESESQAFKDEMKDFTHGSLILNEVSEIR